MFLLVFTFFPFRLYSWLNLAFSTGFLKLLYFAGYNHSHSEFVSVLKTYTVIRMVLVDSGLQPKSSPNSLVKACSLEALQVAAGPASAEEHGILIPTSSIELPVEAYKVLHKLAGKWTDILDPVNLTLTRLKGAMTNNVYECHWERNNGNRPKKVLVRVYGEGSGLFFDRNDEVLTFERMSQKDQGPKLLGRFPNGRVEEFLRARVGSYPSWSLSYANL